MRVLRIVVTNLDFFFENDCSAEKIALLIAHIREVSSLLNALARYSIQVRNNSRASFRQLSLEAQRVTLDSKFGNMFDV